MCPAGYYCDAGTYEPRPCPIGTYNPSTGGDSSDACLDCGAGTYCKDHAMTSTGVNCEDGYYCGEGNANIFQYPCPVGHKC